MANIVNQSFFLRDISLPNLNNPQDLERLNSFISKYESEVLLLILGYPLYKLFGSESSQRMTDLLSGQEYVGINGDTLKWKGLVHDTDISLIANYIYFKYQKYMATYSTGLGTVVQKGGASYPVSPRQKMVDAWNFFSDEVKSMLDFLWNKKDNSGNRVYPEITQFTINSVYNKTRRIDSVFEF